MSSTALIATASPPISASSRRSTPAIATRVSDQQTTTFEDLKDGKFTLRDEVLHRRPARQGSARRSDRTSRMGVKVDLTQPAEPRSSQLAESRFPTEHMLDVIKNAKAGQALLRGSRLRRFRRWRQGVGRRRPWSASRRRRSPGMMPMPTRPAPSPRRPSGR